jgi:hypothetical protein
MHAHIRVPEFKNKFYSVQFSRYAAIIFSALNPHPQETRQLPYRTLHYTPIPPPSIHI